jgi:hypothetical protein
MKNKYVSIAKKILGDDIFEELKKSEIGSGIFKLSTKTTVDPEELKIALQIVPRAILSMLIHNLKPMEIGGAKEIPVFFQKEAVIRINKKASDVYSGDIISEGKILTEFKHRSLPGVGLVLMSTFELYEMADVKQIAEDRESEEQPKVSKLYDIIDDRIKLHCLIKDVVDHRISEREAIQKLINERINESVEEANQEPEDTEDSDSEIIEEEKSTDAGEINEMQMNEEENEGEIEDMKKNKKNKLKEFLEQKEKEKHEIVELDKNENISCPDCGFELFKGEDHFNLCICYGENFNKKIEIKKSSGNKYKFNFPKSFDIENIKMLRDAIKINKE